MAITYTWDSSARDKYNNDGYIHTVHLTVTATDGTKTATAQTLEVLKRPETLIPFADVTKATCVQWCKDSLGSDRVAEIEAELKAEIDEQYLVTVTTVPW